MLDAASTATAVVPKSVDVWSSMEKPGPLRVMAWDDIVSDTEREYRRRLDHNEIDKTWIWKRVGRIVPIPAKGINKNRQLRSIASELKQTGNYEDQNPANIVHRVEEYLKCKGAFDRTEQAVEHLGRKEFKRRAKIKGTYAQPRWLYIRHPLKPNVYFPYHSFHRDILEDKRQEMILLLLGLRAKQAKIWEISEEKSSSSIGFGLQGLEPIGKIAYGTDWSHELNTSIGTVLEGFAQSQSREPEVPEGLVWPKEDDWLNNAVGAAKAGAALWSIEIWHKESYGVTENLQLIIDRMGISGQTKYQGTSSKGWGIAASFQEPTNQGKQPTPKPRKKPGGIAGLLADTIDTVAGAAKGIVDVVEETVTGGSIRGMKDDENQQKPK